MSTNTDTTNRSDRREAVRTLAAAALLALDEIEASIAGELADIRVKMQDAWRWGDGSRLPNSAKRYREAQDACYAGWDYRFDPYDDVSAVLYTAFDWMTRYPHRNVDLDAGMRGLDAAVRLYVGRDKTVMSKICIAVGYDESTLNKQATCNEELQVSADVIDLEDARLGQDIVELGEAVAKNEKERNALRVEIDSMTKFVKSMLPPRPTHLTLVVSNDDRRSSDPVDE